MNTDIDFIEATFSFRDNNRNTTFTVTITGTGAMKNKKWNCKVTEFPVHTPLQTTFASFSAGHPNRSMAAKALSLHLKSYYAG